MAAEIFRRVGKAPSLALQLGDPKGAGTAGNQESVVERLPRRSAGRFRFLERRREEVGDLLRCLFDPEGGDPDGDGFSCDEDCDNGDPDTHPHARDLCGDGRDQDCNGRPDDGPDCPDCTEVSDRRGHRYLVCTTPRTWRASREHCREEGAALEHDGEPPVFDLAVFDDRDEAYWLTRQAMEVTQENRSFWSGLMDKVKGG